MKLGICHMLLGIINGKHATVKCYKMMGTLFSNYKGYFRLVLLTICDASYSFIYSICCGVYGSGNDFCILSNGEVGHNK